MTRALHTLAIVAITSFMATGCTDVHVAKAPLDMDAATTATDARPVETDTDTGPRIPDEPLDRETDNDNDGLTADIDCDDSDPAVGAKSTFYPDADGDGHGGDNGFLMACEAPAGYVEVSGDCDDADPAVVAERTFYVDADGDGTGTADASVVACQLPVGHSDVAGDCDDTDASVVAESTFYLDVDGDGYGVTDESVVACHAPADHSDLAGDCDDENDAVNPGATEYCDGVDNDCNPSTNETNLVTLEESTLMSPAGKSLVTRTNITTQDSATGKRTDIAIDGSTMVNKQTLKVCAGTHYVAITVDGAATIEGVTKGAKLDGSDVGTVITKGGEGTLTITNVRIQNGVGSSDHDAAHYSYTDVAGGVFCEEGSLILDDVMLTNNQATRGGAVFAYGCDVTIENGSWLMNNDADFYGGGVWIREAHLAINESTLATNEVGTISGKVSRGGAIFTAYGKVEIEDSLLTGNKALSDEDAGFGTGGAIHAYGSEIVCKAGYGLHGFTTNQASSGWGSVLSMDESSTFVSEGCDFGSGSTENPGKDIANTQASCIAKHPCYHDPNFQFTTVTNGPKADWDAVSFFEYGDDANITCEWKQYVDCGEHVGGKSCLWRGMECTFN